MDSEKKNQQASSKNEELWKEHETQEIIFEEEEDEPIQQFESIKEAYRDIREKFDSLFTTMAEGVVIYESVYDESGQVVEHLVQDINPAFEVMTGVKKTEVKGKQSEQLFGMSIPLLEEMLASSSQNQQKVSFEMHYDIRDLVLRLSVIPCKENHLITLVEDITAEKSAEKKLNRAVHYDPLTDLPNWFLFQDRLKQGLERGKRYKTQLALLYLDLDDFKQINAEFGHRTGDKVLVEAAQRIKDSIRASDTVARLGGDTFVVIMENFVKLENCEEVAKRIIESLNSPIDLGDALNTIGVSIGIAVYPVTAVTSTDLLHFAEKAMKGIKEMEGNDFAFFSRVDQE